MNILVIAPYGMYQSYTSSFVHNQAKAYVKLGHRVRAVVPLAIAKRSNEGKRFSAPVEIVRKDGVEIYYVRHLSLSSLGSRHFNAHSSKCFVRLFSGQILKGFSPDIIHAHTIGFGGVVAQAFHGKCSAPLVITTHGGDTDVAISSREELAKTTAICSKANAVVAVSPAYLKKAEKIAPPSKCLFIPNGFETQNVQSLPKIFHRITQVGYLVERKHAELTIQAVAKLRERYPDISLTIVGDGPERECFESLCTTLSISDIVHFYGILNNTDAMAEMAKAEFFVMPSVLEGFGIVYLEAMASGCVTVGTKGEGIDGFIVSGQNGFLVSPNSVDDIVRVLEHCFQNPAEASAIAERGRQDAMKQTWEQNATQYIALFRKLLR